MMRSGLTRRSLLTLVLGITLAAGAIAQAPDSGGDKDDRREMADSANGRKTEATAPALVQPPPQAPKKRAPQFLLDFANDQKDLWSSPKNLRFQDASWLVPLSGFSAGLFVTDSTVNRHLSQDPKTISHYSNLSNVGVAALVGAGGGMWVLSHFNHDGHWRETGFLAGQAAIHSFVMTETLKYSLRRERPYQGDGTGPFFHPGGTSFPSEHAAAAWSIASVITHEYPGPLTKFLAYGAASMVSYSRIRAEKHFPSDVLIGALLGELAAHQVYKKHHDLELGGDAWRSPAHLFYEDGHAKPGFIGSPYVPLDSWIYPALDRLAALGLIDSGFAGMRPWTRRECARLISEAGDRIELMDSPAGEIYRLLESEFTPELGAPTAEPQARVESLYTRVENISGAPLRDGYHFAETQINDFGRPYGEGFNSVTGFSSYAAWGPWVGYLRGEWQTAPSIPPLPLSARQFVASADGIPSAPPAIASPSVQQFDLLEAYAGFTFANWQVSFGKQSLDWGPGEGGSLMLGTNAEPINMFRVNRVSPILLPSLLKFMGPVRMEFFVGQLDGHHFVLTDSGVVGSWTQSLTPQPLTQGEKFSFKPSPDLEVGFSYTTIFGGRGVPATLGSFVNALFDKGADLLGGGSKSSRLTGLDFTYRIPKLRKWLTLYGDGFTHDQIIFKPGYPERAVWRAGIHISQFPKIPKLDFRAEGGYTDSPLGGMYSRGFFYTANRYLNGDTNDGRILGSWMGRAGQGAQAWTNYWFTSRDRLQFSFRHQKVSQEFVPGGGTLTDAGVRGDYWLRGRVGLTASVQYEKWLFPVIQPGAQRTVTASVGIQIQPQRVFQPSFHLMGRKTTDAGDQN